MRATTALLVVALLSSVPACARVSISVEQLRGEPAHSFRSRLVEARGEANAAYAVIAGNPRLNDYFTVQADSIPDGLPRPSADTEAAPSRSAKDVIERINRFADRLSEDYGTDKPARAGVPRPANLVQPRPGEDEQDLAIRYYNEEIVRELSAMEKELREFGARLAALDAESVIRSQRASSSVKPGGETPAQQRSPDVDVDVIERDVERLRALGTRLVQHTEYPSFADLLAAGGEWVEINPVKTFGGLGASEFVIVKDDTGNFVLKAASLDSSDVIKAASSAATKAIETIATIEGVPLAKKDGQGGLEETGGEAGKLRTAARTHRDNTARRQAADRRLAAVMREVNEATKTNGGAPPLDDGALDSLRSRMLGALDDYRTATAPPSASK